MMSKTLSFALSLTLSLTAAPSWAESDPGTEAAIERGIRLREAGKDAEALKAFKAAYRRSKGARALAQIALAEQALGRWVAAERHLDAALKSRDPWINQRREPLKQALAVIRQRLAQLTIDVPDVDGATIKINGRRVGTSPLNRPVSVVAGSAVVEVSAPNYWAMTRTLNLQPGSRAREQFVLVAKPPPPPPPMAATPRPPPPPTGSESNQTTTTQANLTKSSDGPDLALPAYITAGGAAVALGVGVAYLFIRNGHVDRYNDDSVCLVGNRTRDENCGDELSSANTAETIMIAGFAGGGVLAATALTLFLLDGSGDDSSTSALGPGPGDVGLSWMARF